MSKRNFAAVVFFLVIAVFFFFSALMVHPFGVPEKADMDDEIIKGAQIETGTNNGVTSVVFDYRGVRNAPSSGIATIKAGECCKRKSIIFILRYPQFL